MSPPIEAFSISKSKEILNDLCNLLGNTFLDYSCMYFNLPPILPPTKISFCVANVNILILPPMLYPMEPFLSC